MFSQREKPRKPKENASHGLAVSSNMHIEGRRETDSRGGDHIMTRGKSGAPDLPSLMSNPRVVESSMASVQGQGKWVEPCGTKRSAVFGTSVSHHHRFSKRSATSLLLSYPPWVLIQKLLELFPFFCRAVTHSFQGYLTQIRFLTKQKCSARVYCNSLVLSHLANLFLTTLMRGN